MIYKSIKKYKAQIKSRKKIGGAKQQDRDIKDLLLIIKEYFYYKFCLVYFKELLY